MPKKEMIEVLVPVDGSDEEIIIEAIGYKGNACDLATKDIERCFTVKAKKHKAEYNAKETVRKTIKLG
jgi:hypothetical protein